MPASERPDPDDALGWRPPGWAAPVTVTLSVVGLAVAGYLTWSHYTTPLALACPDTGVINCTKVTTSPQSMLFGVLPVALLGLGYFAALVGLNLPAAWRSPRPAVRRCRLAAVGVGVASVVYLVYVELFVVDAICLYCTAVHVVTVLLFAATAVATAAAVGADAPDEEGIAAVTGGPDPKRGW